MNAKVLEIAKVLSSAGDAIINIYKNENFGTVLKADNSPVTLADTASCRIINAGIKSIYPGIPVLDEENPIQDYEIRKNWEKYFLLDPLDGTKEFIKKNGEFCINLARIENSYPVEGWIYQPLENKGWYCKKGEGVFEFYDHGAFKKIEVYTKKISTLRIVASRSFFKPLESRIIDEIKKKYPVEITHRGSSLKQIDLISGNADMYLKAGPCSEWDTAPGQLMVEEYGGSVLMQKDFSTMRYNKRNLVNPHFIMLNSNLNNPGFIKYLRSIILKFI